jgi:hypothetical protein
MKPAQFTAADFAKHPLFAATLDIASAYTTALRDNAVQTLDVTARLVKVAPSPDFGKTAAEELTALQTAATSRLYVAHQKAAEVMTEQAQVLSKQVEDFKAKFTA